jgi:predicted Zn finger-like uncharacterized protein
MYVQCPHCETLFRVTSGQLTAADARVRCGQCFTIFNALDNIRVPSEDEIVMRTDNIVAEHKNAADIGKRGNDEVPEILRDDMSNLRAPRLNIRAYSRRATVGYFFLSLLLIMGLGLQIIHANRAQLVKYSELRPVIHALCSLSNCAVPELRAPEQIDLLGRQLYTHPNIEKALMIQASMVNNAPYDQPYPLIELSLSDEQGHIVAMRHFNPDEYLAISEDPLSVMQPGNPVAITLEIQDPGKHALAYEFKFL